MRRLWPGTFRGGGNVAEPFSLLRRTLGEASGREVAEAETGSPLKPFPAQT